MKAASKDMALYTVKNHNMVKVWGAMRRAFVHMINDDIVGIRSIQPVALGYRP